MHIPSIVVVVVSQPSGSCGLAVLQHVLSTVHQSKAQEQIEETEYAHSANCCKEYQENGHPEVVLCHEDLRRGRLEICG